MSKEILALLISLLFFLSQRLEEHKHVLDHFNPVEISIFTISSIPKFPRIIQISQSAGVSALSIATFCTFRSVQSPRRICASETAPISVGLTCTKAFSKYVYEYFETTNGLLNRQPFFPKGEIPLLQATLTSFYSVCRTFEHYRHWSANEEACILVRMTPRKGEIWRDFVKERPGVLGSICCKDIEQAC